MNREFLHKITLLGCLFLLITSSSGTDNGFQTPEQYAQICLLYTSDAADE